MNWSTLAIPVVALAASYATAGESDVEIAQLCVAAAENAKELGAVALGYGKSRELAQYMFDELDPKLTQKADALSIVGGKVTVGLLTHPEVGLAAMRAKAVTCSGGLECDLSLFQQSIVFADYILTACRNDATQGNP